MYLKKKLRSKFMTQNEFAKALGVNPSSVSLWINEILPIPEKHIPKISEMLKTPEKTLKRLAR